MPKISYPDYDGVTILLELHTLFMIYFVEIITSNYKQIMLNMNEGTHIGYLIMSCMCQINRMIHYINGSFD